MDNPDYYGDVKVETLAFERFRESIKVSAKDC
jgi:hypothetical protein